MHDLVSFVQFKKPEKHPWRNVTVTKITLLHERFFTFFKLCKASYIDTDFFNLSILTTRIYALKDINDILGNRFDNEDIERRQRRRTSVFFVNFGLIPHIAVTYPEIFWEYRFQQGILEQEPNRT